MNFSEKYESTDLEFKLKWKDNYLRTVSSLANHEGGEIYVGVNDLGEVVGIDDITINYLLNELPKKIYQELQITPETIKTNIEGKQVGVIKVLKSFKGIAYKNNYYQRLGVFDELLETTQKYYFLEKLKATSLYLDSPTSVSLEDIDLSSLD